MEMWQLKRLMYPDTATFRMANVRIRIAAIFTRGGGMRVDTPEIRWHYGPTGLNEAVLTIDYLRRPILPSAATGGEIDTMSSTPVAADVPSSSSRSTPQQTSLPTVLATAGSDKEVRLWIMPTDDPLPVFVYTLSAHDRSVNCVRFSPDGSILASASDDSTIVLWSRPKHLVDDDASSWDWSTVASNSDVGRVLLACGHKGDITDLSWSPDSQYLCSVSVDNTASIWHVPTAKLIEKRKDHSQFVQGVAWDPLSEFLVTTGNDRSARIYALHGYHGFPTSGAPASKKKKCQLLHTNRSLGPKDCAAAVTASTVADTPVAHPTSSDLVKAPKQLLFHDDTFPSFSRRPTWTPDGNFCIFPAGLAPRDDSTHATPTHTAYVYARGNLLEPAFHLPGHEKGALAIRCSPVLYALRGVPTARNTFGLPYRVIFAVATLTSVAIYDSQLPRPICVVDRVHYADLTDISWSADGTVLAAASLDGYVSLITLTEADVGAPVPPEGATADSTWHPRLAWL
ncbi:hypothetical protein, variant 12 [Aphanomyces invadans]|uniref:CAF1B/HIR1 beta-propeller domain-containing protein n=1 Tax=Aphanomyces invadans TaxID=157072 RepID=A0A024TEX7_9STRA|nr:hypothetical protein, variant 8 [Aphanomyces invadans]XP_008879511.1 hypothetical protein, variant 9 [Aphanomyces invadans]XP_008879512.1 hypothetical protein, variant 10 [Aphanomyces invadans]XP_008879513.1 hypothetical protein, variant 11 [Aphanomyces invadans]XP_008879514.1 hypothetical protein, variant 12 [Aphanomyces invadans]ETV91876.1 hypothetical protein, variant 8 [Aphanomyces invadans]ETV91877.1 hypothetical protein, variant 9 [Aphanomyces invadans]ETV91878.1 hypothetical protei|eukprot:XP_008879510.1 hypothetical protein, variant 8 [Aphanomyces invadans]